VNGTRALCKGAGAPLLFCDRTESEADSVLVDSCNGGGIAIQAPGAPPLHGIVLGFEFDGDHLVAATAHWEVACTGGDCGSSAPAVQVLDGWIMPEAATTDLQGRQAGKVHLELEGFTVDATYDTERTARNCDLLTEAMEFLPASSAIPCEPAESGQASYRAAHDCMIQWRDYGLGAAYVEWQPVAGHHVRSAYVSQETDLGFRAARLDVALDEGAFPVPARWVSAVRCASLTDLGVCASPAADLCLSCAPTAERVELCTE
jgi:hypothetical protein